MLAHDELMDLYRATRTAKVLSIYLHGEQHDPADRNVWRRVLDHGIDTARAACDPNEDVAAFDAAVELLRARLDGFEAFLPAPGWAGFATAERVLYAETVPVPMPDLVRWETGIRAAPYVRALKQERLVVTVLADSRRARIFKYREGQLDGPVNVRAEQFLGDLTDINTAKRATTHTGVRGETGTDVAQRLHDVNADRMLKQVAEVVTDQAGHDGFIVIGGTPEVVAAAASRLPKATAGRVLARPELYVDMTPAEVKEATRLAASELTRQVQNQQLDKVLDAARAHGRGCAGPDETERALSDRRVETLLLSRRFISDNPDHADHFVGAALEQGAEVEELSGDAASRLDQECGGIAAQLRWVGS